MATDFGVHLLEFVDAVPESGEIVDTFQDEGGSQFALLEEGVRADAGEEGAEEDEQREPSHFWKGTAVDGGGCGKRGAVGWEPG